jgi:hypothetical protein
LILFYFSFLFLFDELTFCCIHKCQLTFRIFDQERVFEEDESSSSEKNEDESSKSTKPEKSSNKAGIGRLTSKSKRDTRSEKKDGFCFTQIHYLREIRVPRAVPAEKVPEEEILPELDINELPPLHRAAAKGSI